jgi:hypothetical protein
MGTVYNILTKDLTSVHEMVHEIPVTSSKNLLISD